jgi:hypothetical protein
MVKKERNYCHTLKRGRFPTPRDAWIRHARMYVASVYTVLVEPNQRSDMLVSQSCTRGGPVPGGGRVRVQHMLRTKELLSCVKTMASRRPLDTAGNLEESYRKPGTRVPFSTGYFRLAGISVGSPAVGRKFRTDKLFLTNSLHVLTYSSATKRYAKDYRTVLKIFFIS